MPKIFLSYRRHESAAAAGRIYDRLRGHFGDGEIFMDVDSIPIGVDFREHITAAVDQCDILLAVIGRNWTGEPGNPRRIDEPRDFVRIEIEAALERGIPVVPILIDRATMPNPAELPPTLAPLAYRNAIDLDLGRDFHPHLDRLVTTIARTRQQARTRAAFPSRSASRRRWLWACVALLPVLAFVGVLIHNATSNLNGRRRDESRVISGKDREAPGTAETNTSRAASTPASSPASPSPQQKNVITNSIGMTLRLIPAGEFMMGSDASDPNASDDEFVDKDAGKKEKHRVRITRAFYLGEHEVTRGQFRHFVDDSVYQTDAEKDGKGGYGWNKEAKRFEQNSRYTWRDAGFEQTDEHPVVNVSWNDADAMIKRLSRKERKIYRLPTEAEWEYACRAGIGGVYGESDDPESLARIANVADASLKKVLPNATCIASDDGYTYTSPVGTFAPNAWHLYDMIGNVMEWCDDFYEAGFYKSAATAESKDPHNTNKAPYRVIRGSAWNLDPGHCRPAIRYGNEPGIRGSLRGFRVAAVQE
jgi:formylglycine-generating enzyme